MSRFKNLLIALMLAYDGVVGADENGALLLLMTYPLARWQLLLGELVGQGSVAEETAKAAKKGAAGLLFDLGVT